MPGVGCLQLPVIRGADATVRLLSGRVVSGDLRWSTNSLTIQTPDGIEQFSPEQALSLDLPDEKDANEAGQQQDWQGIDIGDLAGRGLAINSLGTYRLHGAGLGITNLADAFHLFHRGRVAGVELSACLQSLRSSNVQATAGLMLRSSLEPESPFLALAIHQGQVWQIERNQAGTVPRSSRLDPLQPAAWLSLERHGERVRLAWSSDGKSWRHRTVDVSSLSNQMCFAGLMVSGGDSFTTAETRWERLQMAVQGLREECYAGSNFSQLAASRIVPAIDFDGKTAEPIRGHSKAPGSVRWTSQLRVPVRGNYSFWADPEASFRVWIDGQLVSLIHADGDTASALSLNPDHPIQLKVEQVRNPGQPVRFGWRLPDGSRKPIPADQFLTEVETVGSGLYERKKYPVTGTRQGRGLILLNGSFMAGEVLQLDDSRVYFATEGQVNLQLPLEQVARLLFQPGTRQFFENVKVFRRGVFLPTGDFLDGELQEFDGRSLRLSSSLFGIRTFEQAARELAAVALQPVKKDQAPWEVRNRNGSLIYAHELAVSPLGLEMKVAGCDKIIMASGDVLGWRRTSPSSP